METPREDVPGASFSRRSSASVASCPRNHCPTCGKAFRRADALRRHQTVHIRSPPTRKKACGACIKSKIRCSGERPACSSCLRRRTSCSYHHEPISNPKAVTKEVQWNVLESSESKTPEQQTSSIRIELVPPEETRQDNQVNPESGDFSLIPNVFADFDLSGPSFEASVQTGFDWMFYDNHDLNYSMLSSARPDQAPQWNAIPFWRTNETDLPVQGEVLGQQEASHQSPLDTLSVPSAHQEEEVEDRWPMLWRPEAVSLSILAPLGNPKNATSHQIYHSLQKVDFSHIKALTDLIGVPEDQRLWSGVDLSAFPSGEKLDHCIDRYFVHFDKWVPILHRPTFDPGKDPTITLAVIAIGACFTSFDGASKFSNAVMELNRRLLVYMAEHDPRFVRTEYYVITQLLHSIHGFACGSKRSYEIAERERSSLINNARCGRLFDQYPVELSKDDNLEVRWRKWIRAEGFRRAAWAIFVYDAASATMRDDRPFMSLNEIHMDLPCVESHWEAETSQSWAASQPWSDTVPHSESYDGLLEKLLQHPQETLEATPDGYQRCIMLSTLARIMWSYKEQTTQPAARFLTARDATLQAKRDLLQIVDHFHFSPERIWRSLSPAHFAARVQQLQLVRLIYILSGDDAWDYLHLLWRPHPRANIARKHLIEWMQQSPRSFRSFLTANVQLLNIIRLYPDNHPQEPYNTFHSGMAVWALSILHSQAQSANIGDISPTNKSFSGLVCNMDWLGPDDSPEAVVLQNWIENGGDNCVLRMHGVPDLFAPEAPQQILRATAMILDRMSVWGIARTLMNATLRILHSQD